MANYAKINKNDIANGPGVRVSVFFSGCEHYCKGCFNSEAWDFNYGKEFTDKTLLEISNAMKPDYIKGITILGGEPMHPKNIVALCTLLSHIDVTHPDKNVWVYTGYTYEELIGRISLNYLDFKVAEATRFVLKNCIDVLVEGRFIEELKDISLRFRGSSNQRLIDMKSTLEKGEVVLWSD